MISVWTPACRGCALPGDLAFTVDLSGLDEALQRVDKALTTWPSAGNPLLEWRAEYGLRTEGAGRPTVAQGGTFRGNAWPALKPAYHRKTDNVNVPVWGGTPRLRTGRVTRASGTSIRTKASGGRGVVTLGETFHSGPVLGKLKRDGSRYKQGDAQLGKGRAGSLLGDWKTSAPVLRDGGRTIIIKSRAVYADAVHKLRPFAYGGKIDAEETESMKQHIVRYLQGILDRLG